MASGLPIAPEQIVEEVFNVIIHADLPGIMPGGVKRHAAAKARALFSRCLAGAVKCQRKAPEHGGHNPSGVAFIQKKAGGLPFFGCHRPVRQCDVIDQYPGYGVRLHGHMSYPNVVVAMCGRGVQPSAATTDSGAVRFSEAVDGTGQSQSRACSCEHSPNHVVALLTWISGRPAGRADRRRASMAAAAVRPATCPGGASGDARRRGFFGDDETQAGVCFSLDAIPGGRGGPQCVAPALLPVDLPGGGSRRRPDFSQGLL